MSGEKVSFDEASPRQARNEARHNDRSTIVFPYLDLDTAIEVARAIFERAGLGNCEIDELAAQMGQTVSGAFRLKTATAKTFGIIEKGERTSFKLSELGRRIVRPETEQEARATAFLAIPLYKAIFDQYRGHLLPPTKALEREMAALGVAPKQTDKARQTFERSARQAGFFAQGDDRLVQPRLDRESIPPARESTIETIESVSENRRGGGSGGNEGLVAGGRPLEYQLVDLLKLPEISDKEREAIWALVQFLTGGGSKK